MKATLSVVRAYGTHAGYGRDPRETPPGSPVIVNDYPKKAWTTTISLGAPEAWVLDAEGLSQAALRTIFTGEFGRAQKGDSDATASIAGLRRTLGPTGGEWRWWVTIASERFEDVPDDEWLDLPLVWVSPRVTEGLAVDAREATGRGIDALAALIGSTLPNAITGGPAVDRVFLRAPGRQAFPLLTISALPPSVHTSSPEPIDVTSLGSSISRFRPALGRLQTVLYWWARSIEEDDNWRRYQFQFLALEVLANKFKREDGDLAVVRRRGLRPANERHTLAEKFAIMAQSLAPATANDDIAQFAMLKKKRDLMSHGQLAVGAQLPTDVAGRLLSRYMAGVLQRNVPEPTPENAPRR